MVALLLLAVRGPWQVFEPTAVSPFGLVGRKINYMNNTKAYGLLFTVKVP